MSTVTVAAEEMPFVLKFGSLLKPMNDDEFYEFCRQHEDLKIELTSEGDLVITPPTGGETGRRNFSLTVTFGNWVEADGTGEGFDSSTIFKLPNGAKRSPDVAWVERSPWEALTDEERERIPPLCPDFVIELRSRTDSLKALQDKMEEYISNGARLGWLIDPQERKVHVYRPQAPVEILNDPGSVSGEPVLPGCVLPVSRLWRQ
jgi:Uma2 family endonuclease